MPAPQSLEAKLASYSSPFEMMYNNPTGPFQFPVRPEFSNWVDEQRSWRSAAVLQDMSHHMTDVRITGPDVHRLLSDLAVNSLSSFGPMQAKQLVVCNYDGYVIGDAILTCEEDDTVSVLGMPPAGNWVAFHAETGSYEIDEVHVDPPSGDLRDRRVYRFQVQGPNADKILEELNGGPLPHIRFFKMGSFNVGPHRVTALNHRMSGAPGFEFWGPSSDGEAVRDLLLEAGERHGLTQVGGRIYDVTATESGWFGGPVPAVYTADSMRSYRQWLPADGIEGHGSIGGSFHTSDIADLYVNPYDIGYGFMVKFDHDFVGRDALEAMAGRPHRRKVRLNWNADDVAAVFRSLGGGRESFKRMEMPSGAYSTFVCDEVTHDGRRVGMSAGVVYSANVGGWLSLATVEPEHAVDGNDLVVTWGEPGGGSRKVTVERHVQRPVRVTVDTQPTKRHD